MGLTSLDPRPVSEIDTSSTVDMAATPPDTLIADLDDEDPLHDTKPISTSVPWPGNTYIIRSVATWHVITLLDGQIVLAPPTSSRGSTHWRCVETKGWLGFRNPISSKFLGHDARGRLICNADRQQGWENFAIRPKPEGGFVLLLQHFERLWHVGSKVESGMERLAKIADGAADGIVWEFVRIS